MSDAPVGFTKSAARRIARVVRQVERTLPPGRDQQPPDVDRDKGFWIELTGAAATPGWYSWKLVYRNPTIAAGWVDAVPAVTGIDNARESNDTAGLQAGKRYLARFNGYNADDEPVYLFAAADPGLWIKLTEIVTAQGGTYTASVVNAPTADVAASGHAALATVGAVGDPPVTVRAVNATEIGRSTLGATHALPVGGDDDVYPATVRHVNADGTIVVVFRGGHPAQEHFTAYADRYLGENGSPETTCDLAYLVKNFRGQTLGQNLIPIKRWRPANCEMTRPDDGSPCDCYYDEDNVLHLYSIAGENPLCDEVSVGVSLSWDGATKKAVLGTEKILVLENRGAGDPASMQFYNCTGAT